MPTDLILILVSVFSLISLFTAFFWSKFNLKVLQSTASLIVLSYPFERIPSLEIAGVNVRVSQILVLAAFYIIFILFSKKDAVFLSQKVSSFWKWGIAFWVALLPSLFIAINFTRLIQVLIATALVFGASFIVSNFSTNINKTVAHLNYLLVLIGVFGLYQFIGDFIGVPYTLTLLREHYTKKVFGFARIQATALEPLYWGGMLVLPCVYFLIKILLTKNKLFESKKINKKLLLDLVCFSIVYLNLILTLSRGAYLAVFVTVLVSLAVFFHQIIWLNFVRFLLPLISGFLVFSFLTITVVGNGQALFLKATDHLANTLSTKQVSANERLTFLTDAFNILPKNIILGIGSGNYGPNVQQNKPQSDGGWLIVNNVYLEIWLEEGITALLIFISFWIYYLSRGFNKIKKFNLNLNKDKILATGTLFSALIGYLVQWFTFSPIFIMPVFIMLGMLINIIDQN